jgi:COMPASS component SWD1
VEYVEHEDEFDIHPHEEIHKRRLDLEDDDVDPFTIEPSKGQVGDEEPPFVMPVDLDFIDSEAEEEFVAVGRGEMRRKSPTEVREQMLDSEGIGSADEKPKGRSRGRAVPLRVT